MLADGWGRALRRFAALLVLLLVAWFVWAELHRNWVSISTFRIIPSTSHLAAAFAIGLVAFLFDTVAWQRGINGTLAWTAVNFLDSIAMMNTSGVLKYVPGRIWTYGAQMMWLGKRGVPKTVVAYVNLACLMCSMLVAGLLGGAYLIYYVGAARWATLSWVGLVALQVLGILVGPKLLSASFGLIRRFTRLELGEVSAPPRVMGEIYALYAIGWCLMGAAGYYAGLGVGLPITAHDATALTASMAVGWIAGYLAALTPGGIGVREGLMYLMLAKVSSQQAAIVLPVVSRILYVVFELLLGGIGLWIGLRRRLFADANSMPDRVS
jgi:hypothetical protein